MKWFDRKVDQNDTDTFARECIRYLSSHGDRPEKWSALNKLVRMITNKELSKDVVKEAIAIRWRPVYMRIATKADEQVLGFLLDSDIKDQKLYANMAYNTNLTKAQAAQLLEKLDDSERAKSTAKKLQKILDKE